MIFSIILNPDDNDGVYYYNFPKKPEPVFVGLVWKRKNREDFQDSSYYPTDGHNAEIGEIFLAEPKHNLRLCEYLGIEEYLELASSYYTPKYSTEREFTKILKRRPNNNDEEETPRRRRYSI